MDRPGREKAIKTILQEAYCADLCGSDGNECKKEKHGLCLGVIGFMAQYSKQIAALFDELAIRKAERERMREEIIKIKEDIDSRGIESPEVYGYFVVGMTKLLQALKSEK